MYKRDYHPDENIVFKTKNYGFDAPKSTPLEPLSNALVQIDAALKKEETDRIAEDVRINARIDKEETDRIAEDVRINARIDKEETDRIAEDVRINARIDKVETDRIAEDVRINARIDKEIADREKGDTDIRGMLKYYYINNTTPYTGYHGGYENYIFQFLQIGNSVNFTLTINCHGVLDLYLADLFISGTIDSRFPNNTKVAHDYINEQNFASIFIYPNSTAIQVNTNATTNATFCLNGSFTINVV